MPLFEKMMKPGLSLVGLAVASASGIRSLAEIIPYGLEMIQANELELGPNPPLICIVDSGIDIDHPEFDQSMISGIDNHHRYGDEPVRWDEDSMGHGTRVAGIIAAVDDNDVGIQGVANFPLYITRGLDDEGYSYASDVKTAVEQCVDANSKIILLALGGPHNPQHEELYDDMVENKGIMVIAAAGNGEEALPVFPARYDSVIAVGGVKENGEPWGKSAQTVEFVGPADAVPSIRPIDDDNAVNDNGEALDIHALNGTSAASAYVTAAAGLLWSHFEECSNEEIRIALSRTADNWKNENNQVDIKDSRTGIKPEDLQFGHGVPKVLYAFGALKKYGCDLSGVDDISVQGAYLDLIPQELPSSNDEEDSAPIDVEFDPDEFQTSIIETDGLSGGAIGGIVVFSVVVVASIVFVAWLVLVRDLRNAAVPTIENDCAEDNGDVFVDEEEGEQHQQ